MASREAWRAGCRRPTVRPAVLTERPVAALEIPVIATTTRSSSTLFDALKCSGVFDGGAEELWRQQGIGSSGMLNNIGEGPVPVVDSGVHGCEPKYSPLQSAMEIPNTQQVDNFCQCSGLMCGALVQTSLHLDPVRDRSSKGEGAFQSSFHHAGFRVGSRGSVRTVIIVVIAVRITALDLEMDVGCTNTRGSGPLPQQGR